MMRNVIGFRKDGVKRYYGVYRLDLTSAEPSASEVRCPACGRQITEGDVQAGWKQYALDLEGACDVITLLVICPECGKHFAYVVDVRPSK